MKKKKFTSDDELKILIEKRRQIDQEWKALMKDVELGRLNQFTAVILMDKYNKMDNEILELGGRIGNCTPKVGE